MLVPAMTVEEATLEVKRDYDKLVSTTILRLGEEYELERKKLKIDKKRAYTKIYTVKTARKNNWIIFIGKAPSSEVYTDRCHLSYAAVTYFWDDDGFKVLRYTDPVLQIYQAHVFVRYNTRMKLGLDSPIEIAKHYFKNNRYSENKVRVKNGQCYNIAFSQDGLLLGNFYDLKWILWRTFVSRDLIRHHQQKKEQKGIKELGHETLKTFIEKKDYLPSYRRQLDKLKVLTGQYNVE